MDGKEFLLIVSLDLLAAADTPSVQSYPMPATSSSDSDMFIFKIRQQKPSFEKNGSERDAACQKNERTGRECGSEPARELLIDY
ncbi:aspartate-semialdehyde dehydrogenase [Anopheles sinensis]|uniref:Aspartate-semialdehyde dehydrogenase n=1 Tax=Anopheles sinensis TaxID=74873 RepID=A0A084VEL6_ANOSI|nr:aspartate-semialdehyde dehydrogenase [Anopheles sinensis]